MKNVELKSLMQAGVHFGHKSVNWNPKMGPFLYGTKAGVHIFNLEKTKSQLEEAYEFIKKTVAGGGTVLFVGTKPQAKDIVRKYAAEAGMPFVTERWLGGTLTNFVEINKLVKKLNHLIQSSNHEDYEQKYTKKERLIFSEEMVALEKTIGGIVTLLKLPDVIFVASVKADKIAVTEAIKTNVKIVGICDSNTNPDKVDYVVPANDDALKSIELLAAYFAAAVKAGKEEALQQKQEIQIENKNVE
ncbi:MAG TPA: 30S ribosomal protein S2 [bacterium]|nr:30S ribosomal protein S2 [bacterium]